MATDDPSRPTSPLEPGGGDPRRTVKLEIDPAVARGVFVNAAIVTHTHDAFFLDLALAYPNQPVRVQARAITSPQHAKALLRTLAENVARYEKRFGAIPERPLPPRPSEDAPDTTN
jgi:hypothetical protein